MIFKPEIYPYQTRLEELESVDHLCKVATDKAEKANQTIAKLTKELKSLKGKLAEQKDLEIDRLSLIRSLQTKKNLKIKKIIIDVNFMPKKLDAINSNGN